MAAAVAELKQGASVIKPVRCPSLPHKVKQLVEFTTQALLLLLLLVPLLLVVI